MRVQYDIHIYQNTIVLRVARRSFKRLAHNFATGRKGLDLGEIFQHDFRTWQQTLRRRRISLFRWIGQTVLRIPSSHEYTQILK